MGNTFSSAEKELDIDKTAKQIDKTTKQLFNKNKEVSFLENHPTEKKENKRTRSRGITRFYKIKESTTEKKGGKKKISKTKKRIVKNKK